MQACSAAQDAAGGGHDAADEDVSTLEAAREGERRRAAGQQGHAGQRLLLEEPGHHLLGLLRQRQCGREQEHIGGRHDWVVYAKPPFGGAHQVLRYLARYTHRIAIGEHRLANVDDESFTFDWKDYRHGNAIKQMKLDGAVFLGRLLQHVLPRSYTRLRSYGFLANSGKREKLLAIRACLGVQAPPPTTTERACLCPLCGLGALVDRQMLEPWTLLPRSNSS